MTEPRKLLNDCFLHDKDRLRHDDVLTLLRERISTVAGTETIVLEAACGRILAQPIIAPRNVPLSDNAAVDGYAFCHADFKAVGGWFEVADRVAAGHARKQAMPRQTAARIFTGAAMPDGLDTVAMQEDCEPHIQNDRPFVAIPPGLKQGANCRKSGEDVLEGTTVLVAGDSLRAQDLAAIASLGISEVVVYRKLKVALLSTGDELLRPAPGVAPQPGQVFDANFFMLKGLLETLPVVVTDFGILPDDARLIRETISTAAAGHDMILTSGGASRGDEDHIITALDALGQRHLWQLAIKPGRPMTMGQIGDCVFVGLPGNPVAAFVCFLLYVRQIILSLQGSAWHDPVRFPVKAAFAIARKKPDRREFLRGILGRAEPDTLSVTKFDRDGSGLITSLREADGLIEIPEAVTQIEPGDTVSFIPFTELGLPSR
uniref:molybdopterin molybdotransferase MoeA n=1 Tax=Pararhizobium sp. IMCC3301 TaxID=3067904 RepID=UPI002740AC22|nr:gephyrin-like molybdotransferase Glp [Pararhizobium sp. IMCC3301]